jgi:hypothetical protein
MSEATIEALESDAYEGEGEAYGEGGYEGEAYGEGGYEGEAYGEGSYEAYGESARSDARNRRARQQQQILAARRARLRRPPAPPLRRPAVMAPRPSQRQAMPAIRSVDLDLKMELDSLRRQLAKARRNGNLAMYSAVLSAVGSQGIDTFGDRLKKHDVVKAAVRAAPLGLLWPQHGRNGVEGVLLHPAFIGAVGIAAIVISGKVVSAPHAVDSISVISPVNVPDKGSAPLSAVAVDRKGNAVPNISIAWTSLDTTAATVDSNGVCTGVKGAVGKQVVITAAGGGATGRIVVNVVVTP